MFGYLEIFLKVYLYLSLEPNSLTVVNLQKRAISAQQKEFTQEGTNCRPNLKLQSVLQIVYFEGRKKIYNTE